MQYAQSWVYVYLAGNMEDWKPVFQLSSSQSFSLTCLQMVLTFFFPDHLSPCYLQPHSKTLAPYSSDTDRRLKMGRRRPSKLGDSAPPEEEELREQEEV